MDRVGHYVLESRIGAGGMGEVYRARDAALGRPAAVKVILPGGDDALRDRLLREAESTARLQHPFIATFFDGGIDQGRAWLALEYVPGETLRSRLNRGPLALSDAVAVGLALLEALVHAHAAGVLHRDLKPENVMLRPDGHVKLLDFGLARSVEASAGETIQQLTMVGVAVGTIGYMPPEQLRGELVDGRADLFAVGAVLYECLTGRAAFAGRTAVERIAAVLADDRPSLPPEFPPGLSGLIARALSKSPDGRPATAAAFLRELREVSEHGDTAVVGAEPATLAIADFDNLSADPASDWIGSGIAESVAADLARISGLQVIARERWLQARAGVGAAPADPLATALTLGARWLLSGGFQRLGPALRLTARLADVSSGALTWVDKLDGPVEQIFSMQDRVASSVARALNLNRPTPAPVRPQLTAYECYARGRRLFERLDKSSMERADELYQQAIEIDPAYAPAYAGLSGIYAMRYTFTTDPSVLDRAVEFASRALEVDPAMGEPHVWRGYAHWRLGQHEEALEGIRQGMALDPTLHKGPYFAGAILLDHGRPREALPLEQRAVEIGPAFPYAWLLLGLVHLRLDQLDEAVYCFERAVRLEREDNNPIVGAEAAAAEALRRAGKLELARAGALSALERIEGADHMYRDTHRGAALIVLGRCAFDQQDWDAAAAAFGQAAAHLRGRPRALGGGHLLVQALAGCAMAARNRAFLDDALDLFQTRGTHHFGWAFLADETETRLQLAFAASNLHHDQAGALVAAVLPAATPRERAALERRAI
jgi:TolB-like protein